MEQVSIYPKWLHKAQFAGIYMAKEKGFFAAQDLNVTILDYDPSVNVNDAMAAAMADYYIHDTVVFTEIDNGLDFVVIAAYAQRSLWSLTYHPDVPSLEALNGKPIALASFVDETLARQMFDSMGLDKSEHVLFKDNEEFQRLLAYDEIAGVLGYRSNEEYFFKQRYPDAKVHDPTIVGTERVGNSEREVGSYSDILVTSREEATAHPQRALKMVTAINQGWRYAIDNPEETLKTIYKRYPTILEHFSHEQSQHELALMAESVAPGYIDIGNQSMRRWQLMVDVLKKSGLMPNTEIELSDYIWTRERLAEQISENRQSWLVVMFWVVAAVSVATLLFLFTMRKVVTRALTSTLMGLRIREAINNKEFIFYFQPLCDADGHIESYEALIRWQHKSRGLLTPNFFLDYVEASPNLSQTLDCYAIDQILGHLAKLPTHERATIKVAINVSHYFFTRHNYERFLEQMVEKHQVPLTHIELELTERLEAQAIDYLSYAVETLKRKGLGVSLDDYGTGYTSLNILNQVAFNKLKIDRSLINDITNSRRARGTCESIILMAMTHGMDLVCEGVETQEQVECLVELMAQCQAHHSTHRHTQLIIQGYFFGKPAEFEHYYGYSQPLPMEKAE
ncbi:EAL domain-containing protein [Corallincola platygyrae]|uniref:EAL domain-containing protein n=1 Tax=Corallincola platygyrae TaxID=1193278 RepID=A0ABW4XJN9_9GAMM